MDIVMSRRITTDKNAMLRQLILISLAVLSIAQSREVVGQNEKPNSGDPNFWGGMRLLDGYTFQRGKTFDTINGKILGPSGFTIGFESGTGAGYEADPARRSQYISFREQVVNGHKVYLALAKPRRDSPWRPRERSRGGTGRMLLVTFPGKMSELDAANFWAEVLTEAEIADMLLMVLTFDPSR
jgi:hypothetical protein